MSPEIISQVAAVTGYGIGLAMEQRALQNAQRNAEKLQLEAATAAIQESEQAAPEQPSRFRQWVGRSALAPLALTAAGAAGLVTYAYKQEAETIVPPTQPGLEMVVDHSGATNLTLGSTPAVDEINSLTRRFTDEDVKAEALVASNGKVQSTPVEKIGQLPPFGDAPMEQATNLAIDKATANAIEGQNSVLAITNGNSLGDVNDLSRKAQRAGTPVFVVNVEEANKTSGELKADLKQLANKTGGEYWDANEKNLDEVSDDVQATLVAEEAETNSPSRLPIIEFGALLVGGMVGYFRRRSQYASYKDFKGE